MTPLSPQLQALSDQQAVLIHRAETILQDKPLPYWDDELQAISAELWRLQRDGDKCQIE